jgi:hypothetical protein
MTTHVANSPPSTRITMSDGASISVETLNVNKELPKETFSKYIPQRFAIDYEDIDEHDFTYILASPVDSAFINHLSLYVDNTLIERTSSIDHTAQQYTINQGLDTITVSSALYADMDLLDIFVVYTPS